MTRETKVGLLVGLGIILLIGIIVSDHLSVAQHQDAATLTDLARKAQQSIGSISTQSRTNQNARSNSAPRTPWGGNANSPRPRPVPMPAELSSPEPSQQNNQPALPRHDMLVSANRQSIETPPRLPAAAPTVMPTLSQTHAGQPDVDPTPIARLQPQQPSAASEPRVAAAQPTIHYVKAGETLWQIAQQYYGNGEHWRTIVQANPGRVAASGTVRQGVRLVIPNKAGLADSPSTGVLVSNRSDPTQSPITSTPRTADTRQAVGQDRMVEVEPGDSLSLLAKQHLGSSDRWRELFEANRDQLKQPDAIRAGMKLRLPGASQKESPAPSAQPANSGSKTGTYRVKPSDSLSSIAQLTLGDRNRWEEIFEANRKRLRDPDDIQVGQMLTIPAR